MANINYSNKEISRLAQLLLFSAGHEVKLNLLEGINIDAIIISRYGNHPLYQSDWQIYKTLLERAKKNPGEIIRITTAQLIKESGRSNNLSARKSIEKIAISLPSTFLVIKLNKKSTDTKAIFSAPLVDHISIKNGQMVFCINQGTIDFWLSGEWKCYEDDHRTKIGCAELSLWLYALSQVISGNTTPPISQLLIMSATKISRESNFLQHIKKAMTAINTHTTIHSELDKNAAGQHIVVFKQIHKHEAKE